MIPHLSKASSLKRHSVTYAWVFFVVGQIHDFVQSCCVYVQNHCVTRGCEVEHVSSHQYTHTLTRKYAVIFTH